jgi:hypothetical protein
MSVKLLQMLINNASSRNRVALKTIIAQSDVTVYTYWTAE